MPCYDSRDSPSYSDPQAGILNKWELEAILCGAIRASPEILNWINWEEVGLTQEAAEMWWSRHRKNDNRRRPK